MTLVRKFVCSVRKFYSSDNKEAKIPLYNEKDTKGVFFIVSAGRSGTSLLRRMLLAGREVYIPPESYVLPRIIMLHKRNPGLDWQSIVYLVLSIYEYENQEFPDWNISLKPLVAILLDIKPEERSLARILTEINIYLARENGFSALRWGDKTPIYFRNLPDLLEIFPDAKFVHMLRDGVDVVSSMMNMGRNDMGFDDFAIRWKNSVNSFDNFSALYPDKCTEVRYEELVTNPEETIKKICKFLSLEYDANMINALNVPQDVAHFKHHINLGKKVSTASIGKGYSILSKDEKRNLESCFGQEMKLKGYDLPG